MWLHDINMSAKSMSFPTVNKYIPDKTDHVINSVPYTKFWGPGCLICQWFDSRKFFRSFLKALRGSTAHVRGQNGAAVPTWYSNNDDNDDDEETWWWWRKMMMMMKNNDDDDDEEKWWWWLLFTFIIIIMMIIYYDDDYYCDDDGDDDDDDNDNYDDYIYIYIHYIYILYIYIWKNGLSEKCGIPNALCHHFAHSNWYTFVNSDMSRFETTSRISIAHPFELSGLHILIISPLYYL